MLKINIEFPQVAPRAWFEHATCCLRRSYRLRC